MGRIHVSFQFPAGELRDGFEVNDELRPEEIIQRLQNQAGLGDPPPGHEWKLYLKQGTKNLPLYPDMRLRDQTPTVEDGAQLAVIGEPFAARGRERR